MSENARFTYAVSTMGCKANLTDSQALEDRLQALGGRAAEAEAADVFLLNTCTVTDGADKEARQILRKTQNPLTIATGCLAEVDPEQLSKASETVRIVRNAAKENLESVVQEWLNGVLDDKNRIRHGDRTGWHKKILANRSEPTLAPSGIVRTRAFYKVQDGCNAFCSYCVIPLARGRSRSLPAATVTAEIQKLVDQGMKEVALTAIHAADYDDAGLDFTGLVARVLKETTVPRLRLTSLDPAEIPDRLIELMVSEPRLCPHFHVSLQSGSDRVLTAMKRAYDGAMIEDRFLKIKERLPHAYVGLDVIAGFPGETDAEFEETFSRLERLPWAKAHVFPFSVRRNTAAARLVEAGIAVTPAKIRERAARLRELSARKMAEALAAKVGTVQEVLIEAKSIQIGTRTCSTGHARNFHKVVLPGRQEPNQLRRVKIVGVLERDALKGEFL